MVLLGLASNFDWSDVNRFYLPKELYFYPFFAASWSSYVNTVEVSLMSFLIGKSCLCEITESEVSFAPGKREECCFVTNKKCGISYMCVWNISS